MSSQITDALASFRARMPQVVREEEVLRLAAAFPLHTKPQDVTEARRLLLSWAQRRAGAKLPDHAWTGESFDHLAGGRFTMGVKVTGNAADIWALRVDDPDKTVPGRVWTTEIVVGQASDGPPRLCVRLLTSTTEERLGISPHGPGFLQGLAERFDLRVGRIKLSSAAWHLSTEDDVAKLIDCLSDPTRRIPVFVATGDERSSDQTEPLIDAELLARATIGLALVVVVPADLTYALSDAVGRIRSVYHGAVRIYLPGFDEFANPYEHRLFLAESIREAEAAERCVQTLREFAARESLIRYKLDTDVLTFASVRTAALKAKSARQALEGASDADQLKVAQGQIQALEDELKRAKEWEHQLTTLHDEMEARSLASEAQLRAASAHIQQLRSNLVERGQALDAVVEFPSAWADFVDWCDQQMAGRVTLSPSARRGIKKAEFDDVSLAARCVLWLATECRDRRIGGGGSVSDSLVENGVHNSSCGSDTYTFDFQGRRLEADWHVKNGGNTRDPTRCLRIYYGWDEQAQQIIISDMPAHIRTTAS